MEQYYEQLYLAMSHRSVTQTLKIGAFIVFLSILVIFFCLFLQRPVVQPKNASSVLRKIRNTILLNPNPYPKSGETQYIDIDAYKHYNRTNNTIS